MPVLLAAHGMTLDTEIILGVVTLCFTVIEILRTFKKDSKEDASNLTTVIVKLENIQSSINDIKSDISRMEKENKSLAERVSKTEEKLSSLWKYYETLYDDVKELSHHDKVHDQH